MGADKGIIVSTNIVINSLRRNLYRLLKISSNLNRGLNCSAGTQSVGKLCGNAVLHEKRFCRLLGSDVGSDSSGQYAHACYCPERVAEDSRQLVEKNFCFRNGFCR